MVLSEEQKRSFIRDGFVILRDVVPRPMVDAALRVMDKAFAEGNYTLNDHNKQDVVPFFKHEVEQAAEIERMMSATCLIEACEDLLGKGNCYYGKGAQIAFRPSDERLKEQGMGMTQNMPKHRWHIDGGSGKYMKTASSFTMLAAVALSDGQDVDENRGQFNVWPGTWWLKRLAKRFACVLRDVFLTSVICIFAFCDPCRLPHETAPTIVRAREKGIVSVEVRKRFRR